ncbi:MAG: dTDP-4-dehydrorhamnose reductase [Proteobacteria bacterium]|nr:dTDP-4-dehydrorhamnose reductase [Pseudomonadota bacterium]MBU0965192.1 dTDP-4-dehydrorhamnose reductase [Pseudomonadota bacterium]
MKILVTGINGQVGWELLRQGPLHDCRIIGFAHNTLDITDSQAVSRELENNSPDLVINCGAYTAVDKAEAEEKKAWAVNRDGPAWLAASCAREHIPLIHLSTDYVFNGLASKPYTETSATAPLGVYGKSKAAGEEEVRAKLSNHLIIRTSWVYGIHGQNFVKTILRLVQEKEELKVVDDQWGCPTFAGDLALALLTMAKKIHTGQTNCWGTYHCCGATAVTWCAFATFILDLARKIHPVKVRNIIPITSEEYPTTAPRPKYSVLDCQKVYSVFGIRLPALSTSLDAFFAEQGK